LYRSSNYTLAPLPALMQRSSAGADVAAQLAALRQAALADEDGSALEALLVELAAA